jgi:hypothetical protein
MIHQNCRRPNLEKFLPTYLAVDVDVAVAAVAAVAADVAVAVSGLCWPWLGFFRGSFGF